MRGEQKLSKQFISNTPPATKGRNADLVLKRDKALASRFYYYDAICRMRYDAIMNTLRNEFYLCENSLLFRLNLMQHHITKLHAEKVTVCKLKNEYPFYNWK